MIFAHEAAVTNQFPNSVENWTLEIASVFHGSNAIKKIHKAILSLLIGSLERELTDPDKRIFISQLNPINHEANP